MSESNVSTYKDNQQSSPKVYIKEISKQFNIPTINQDYTVYRTWTSRQIQGSEIADLKSEIEYLKSEIEYLESDIAIYEDDLDELQDQVDQLQLALQMVISDYVPKRYQQDIEYY